MVGDDDRKEVSNMIAIFQTQKIKEIILVPLLEIENEKSWFGSKNVLFQTFLKLYRQIEIQDWGFRGQTGLENNKLENKLNKINTWTGGPVPNPEWKKQKEKMRSLRSDSQSLSF